MKKRARRLSLHRETLAHLNPGQLQPAAGGGGFDIIRETEDPACYSPLCAPTFWKGCEQGAIG